MKPLAGRAIIVTRSREQAGDLAAALESRGARVVEAPVIAFEEPRDWSPVDAAIGRLGSYDRILFTSANAVERFAARAAGGPASTTWPRIVAIGQSTARALERRDLKVDEIATDARAEGVLALLAGRELRGARILLPRAETARETLPEELRARGALVDVVVVYRTVSLPVTDEVRSLVVAHAIDVVTFTSPSTVTNLIAALGGADPLKGIEIAVIGPVTARAADEAGIPPTIVSAGASMAELAEAIAARYASR